MEEPVLSGQVPSVTGLYIPRRESGLSPASLPADQTTVLLPGEESLSGLDWLGGTGKTAQASALAQACWETGAVRLIVWVAVSGRDAVMSGYARALRELDPVPHKGANAEHAAGRFLDWLAKADQPWLVVLDDLADPADIDGLWPAGSAGRVLVTARQADAAAAAHRPRLARVGPFSPREALDYLSASLQADPGQRVGAPDLAGDLGFTPVALGLAAAFMDHTGLGCRDYRARFAERRRTLAEAFPDDFSLAAATTWALSCELADQLPPRGLAGRVLALISMLTPHGIPGAVLTSEAARAYLAASQGTVADVAEVRAAVHNLARTGLVTVNNTSAARTVQVHEMLQVITRHQLPAAEGQRAARAAADALAQAWSSCDLASPAAQALRDCTAKLSEIAGTFLWTPQCHPALLQAGRSLDAEGLAGPAAAYWETTFGISRQVLGAEHPQTIGVRDLLGSAYEASGRPGDALAIYEVAFHDAERARGSAHPDTWLARERLTRMYVAAGRGTEAVHLAEEVLAGCVQNLGPDHPETLAAEATLAGIHLGAGRLDEATAELQNVLARRERLLGQEHPDTTAARASLADAHRESGRFKEAIALGKRVLADTEGRQGPDHPDTIAARVSLASSYRSAKKLKDALRLYERILADRERGQGADHPDTILARSDVALAYLSTRKLAVAIAQYEHALADSERVLGRDHPITEAVRESLQEAAAYTGSVLGIDLRSHRS
jgi:tetratricopeptide (TPR) repeat protein